VPYVGTEYVCPSCEMPIPNDKLLILKKPPRYAHLLNDVFRCPECRLIFSYRSRAVAITR
jgi:hypothetical protein